MVFAAIPFVAVVIAIAAMVGKGGELVWALGLALCPFALLVSGGFAIAGKRTIALESRRFRDWSPRSYLKLLCRSGNACSIAARAHLRSARCQRLPVSTGGKRDGES